MDDVKPHIWPAENRRPADFGRVTFGNFDVAAKTEGPVTSLDKIEERIAAPIRVKSHLRAEYPPLPIYRCD